MFVNFDEENTTTPVEETPVEETPATEEAPQA
jgi:hypothetical protein